MNLAPAYRVRSVRGRGGTRKGRAALVPLLLGGTATSIAHHPAAGFGFVLQSSGRQTLLPAQRSRPSLAPAVELVIAAHPGESAA